MNDTRISLLVDQIDTALRELADVMTDPTSLHFETDHPQFERLERSLEQKSGIDAAFAWAADMHHAGGKVGSSRSTDYLIQRLGLSRSEALTRLQRGRALFDPPSESPPPPAADESEQRAAAARARREKKAQAEARRKQASAEKRRIIDSALEALHKDADPGYHELLNKALTYSEFHAVDHLRDWIREQVRLANLAVDRLIRHNIAFDKRRISFSKPDANGGVHVHMYLPSDAAAVLSEAINPARSQLLEGSDLQVDDPLTWNQRMVNLLVGMCRDFLNTKTPNLKGVGSIVVSMTMAELENMSLGDVFPTNTGHLVDPFALIRLGEATSDFFVVHGSRGEPLHADTGKRTASLRQRIALFASELVCSAEGCDRPMNQCQAHHILPHAQSGPTDIANLTQLCWGHHRDNNDLRNPLSPFGWADRDPHSGRVGTRRDASSPVRVNDSPAAARSGGAKIRAHYPA